MRRLFGDAPDSLVLANPINAELDAMRPLDPAQS